MEKILMTFAMALVIVLILGPIFIPILHKLHFGQAIREEGPKSHQSKSGTPTMGGIFLIASIAISTLIFAEWSTEIFIALFILIGHFILGFIDDYLKVVRKNNQGLLARYKFLGQIVIALVTSQLLNNFVSEIWIPLADVEIEAGILYLPFMLFVLIGTSNAVNLTDGLDGLAAGCMAISASCYTIICLLTGHDELAIFCAAIVGACIGFLKFNFHPAKIFMGDTGSLALGGALAAVGILTHTEILLAIVGFVFVCETLSVILQVISFQTTGKRIFRMSPLHHHFELGGWSEVKVIIVFWMISLIFGLIGLSLL